MLPRLFLQFAVTAMLLTSNAVVLGDDFPGNKPNKRVIKSQEKVDALFEKGDYERAAFIYREELAPLGDKYAQYMIGYMYLTGKDAMLVANFIERDINALFDEVMIYSEARAFEREYKPTRRDISKYEELIQAIENRLNFLAEMQASGRMYGEDEIMRYEQLLYRSDVLIDAYEDEN